MQRPRLIVSICMGNSTKIQRVNAFYQPAGDLREISGHFPENQEI